jgi:pre-rRNA-processing protein IPI1
LAYLTTQITSQPVNAPLPLPTAILLPKLLPLILDGSASVRSHLLKLLRQLPASDMESRGMTHLASEISSDALDVLEWLLEVAKDDAVSCPGGWFKTLKCFMSMMHWRISKESTHGWSSEPKATLGKAGETFPRQMLVLAQFLKAGLIEEKVEVPYNRAAHFPLWDVEIHMIPKKSGIYNRLNLFGPPRDEEGEMYMDVEGRQRVFHAHFRKAIEAGIINAKKVAGEAGRAASVLDKAMREGMADYQSEDPA